MTDDYTDKITQKLKSPERVADAFQNFLAVNSLFRQANGLDVKTIDNPHEILVGAFDKLARASRQVKHFERNDPKPDWPDAIAEDITGALTYMLMLLDKYGVDIGKGMVAELSKAADQHAEKSHVEKPWRLPNDHGEYPGDICCQRSGGKFCYDHDKKNYKGEE